MTALHTHLHGIKLELALQICKHGERRNVQRAANIGKDVIITAIVPQAKHIAHIA